jgi:formylglycine-generating enzyme required for sulfatase activity
MQRCIKMLLIPLYAGLAMSYCHCFAQGTKGELETLRRSLALGADELRFRVGRAEFVLKRIPAGEFDMGSSPTEPTAKPNELPLRHVRISRAFYLGKTPVTQFQYREVMGRHLTVFKGDALPVDAVHYSDALKFCEKASETVGLKITLPTEAQWEYACRGGSHSRFILGDKEADLDKIAWYKKNSNGMTHKVGVKQPNGFGLFDMLGNVCEPCLDELPDYKTIAPVDPNGEVRPGGGMMRGGCWGDVAMDCRPARRLPSCNLFGGMGIRIAIASEQKLTSEDKKHDEQEKRKWKGK